MVGSRFGLWSKIKRVAASDTISGLIMLGFALVGLLLANIPVTSHLFESIAETHMAVPYTNIDLPLGHWAQDGLLTIFFLVVGLDLKQELTTGSLANPKAAAVPMACAVGGMAVPPLLFLLVTWLFSAFGPPAPGLEIVASGAVHPFSAISQGWAIPMATDIAFSLTVLALFAKGLPGSIRAFLMTLATVDDLLAVLVIALFFSSLNAWYWFLGIVVCAVAWAYLVRRRRVPWPVVVIVGVLAWVMMFEAGVHPTLAGVLVGLLTPSREMHGEASPRAERYKEKLQPFSALLALPIFALFATGVHFEALSPAMMVSPVVLGIVAALVIGKPLGIMITAWLSTHAIGLSLPKGLRVRDLFPAACACGIGFTVSFLLATLAYDDPELSGEARFGVLVGSLISAMVAGLLLNHQARGFRSRAAERELAEAARKVAGADANIEEVLADGSITISMKALSPEAIRRYRERHPERFATEEGSSSEEGRRTTTVKPGSRHISRLKRRMRELGRGAGKASGSKRGRGHRR